MAPIAVGDTIPDGNLTFLNEEFELETVSIYSLITGKNVLIMGVPGAFIPSSSWFYEPPLIRMASHPSLQETLYITVNDPYVMWSWKKKFFPTNAPNLKFLADSKAAYVTSLGLDLDLTSQGFGVRCKKFSILLQDRKVVRICESQMVLDPLSPALENSAIVVVLEGGCQEFIQRPMPNASRAPIAVGDIIPDGTLTFVNQSMQIQPVSVHSIVAGKKVIVFGVRGAFLPNCSNYWVPSFIEKADEFKSMGVQEILCISVNDPYTMMAWSKLCLRCTTKINFLADSAAAYVTSLGLVAHLSRAGLGIRSKKFALFLDDCRVKVVEVRRARPGTVHNGIFDQLAVEDMLAAMVRAQ